jgi:hypothetical protein
MKTLGYLILMTGFATNASGRNLDRNTPPPRGGKATLHGIVGGESRMVPALVDRVVGSDDLNKYLEGSGFTYKVVARKKGTGRASGTILSQTPGESSEVFRAVEIHIIVAE